MILEKTDREVLSQFADWLSHRWTQEKFEHFDVERRGARLRKSDQHPWSIQHLLQARDQYIWNGMTLAENADETKPLAERLLLSLEKNLVREALSACLAILRWGNVDKPTKAGERPSVKWLREAAEAGNLCNKIKSAVVLLKHGDVERFDGDDLIMDSGMTKVLSPIYSSGLRSSVG